MQPYRHHSLMTRFFNASGKGAGQKRQLPFPQCVTTQTDLPHMTVAGQPTSMHWNWGMMVSFPEVLMMGGPLSRASDARRRVSAFR